nr:MBL fold metallo-hydrolase [Woeseiaceae bacterium]
MLSSIAASRTCLSPVLVLALLLAGCGSSDSDEPVAIDDGAQIENRGAGKDEWWSALPRVEWQQHERILESVEWFEVYRLYDSVFAIYEPGQFEEVISFLIVGDERALLFDTGLGIGDIRSVAERLTDLDIVVLNSHSHYDHIGGNHQFEEVLSLDNPYTISRAAGSDAEAVAEFIGPGWVWQPLPTGFDPASFRSEPYDITGFVAEGSVIDLGGRQLEVLETPGHAPDALCLFDRENGMLFVGDTFYLASLYTHLEGSDFDLYLGTAQRLAELSMEVDFVF